MKTFRKSSKTVSLILVLSLVCALLISCGASKDGMSMGNSAGSVEYESYDKNFSYSTSAPKEEVLFDTELDYAEAPEGASGEVTTADPLAGRKIITTFNIVSETKEFNITLAALESEVAMLGGYIQSSNIYGNSIGNNYRQTRSATYTLRIPAEKADGFISSVGTLVNITSKRSSVNDITDSYTDIEARLNTLKTEESRLLALLEKGNDLQYIIQVEDRLSNVRYEIESYTARLRGYDTLVAFSTVNIEIREVIDYTETPVDDPTFGERLGAALSDGWKSFAEGWQNFTVGLAYSLPSIICFVVIIGAAVIVTVVKIKRRKAKKAEVKEETTDSAK